MWGLHDFCLTITSFQVQLIMQAQLNTPSLSQTAKWGNAKNPWLQMVFLLIVPSLDMGCKQAFGLVAVWAHPCKACYATLAEAGHKLTLLIDGSADCVYAFIQLDKESFHAPLSTEGHLSATTDSMPSADIQASSTNSRYIKCYSMETGWCIQRALIARWKPPSSIMGILHCRTLQPLVNLSVNQS